MKSVTRYPPGQWAEARRLHAEGVSFAAIADRLGFRRLETIRLRARKEGWSKASVARAGGKPRAVRSRRLAPSAARSHRALARRLYGYMGLDLQTLELRMQKRLDDYRKSPKAEALVVTEDERTSFAALIDNINKVTEMASEPALAADGRRKSATLDPELTALSDELDADAFAAASQKVELRREIADELEKLGPPPAST